MDECPVCGVYLNIAKREKCFQPLCPCFGTVIGSAEMEQAATRAAARPYSRRMDPAGLLADLEARAADPVEARALARMRETDRLRDRTPRNLSGRDALAALGIDFVGHEAGWPA